MEYVGGVLLADMLNRVLDNNRYLVLATADAAGRPWATPVFFAARGPGELYWVSAPGSRHSANIAARPDIAITVFDSTVPIGGAEAVYFEAHARQVEELDALETLNARLPADKQLTTDDVSGPMRIFRADVRRRFVLVRGGNAEFGNVTDARIEI